MFKGTIASHSGIAVVLLALGCGGKAEEQGSPGAGGGEATSGAPSVAMPFAGSSAGGSPPGVGPIDTTGLPTELPMDCVGPMSPPRLVLPCKVGMAPLYALECYDS